MFLYFRQADQVPLSPLPQGRSILVSPKRITANRSIYIQPLERNETVPESPDSITYKFYSSPAKDLLKINSCVANGNRSRKLIKRNLPFDDGIPIVSSSPTKVKKIENTPPTRYSPMNQKLKNLISDRQHHIKE